MKLVHYPEEILLKDILENKITSFSDEKVSYLINKMFKIMKANNGIGLAANQIGSDKSIFIMAIPFEEMILERIFINPQIILSGYDISIEEGCLSFPGIRVEVPRFDTCEISYQDLSGNKKEKVFKGLPSIVIQHEFDHLLGKTFIDHLPDLTKQEISAKLLAK
jgi:peptide deformylase